MIWLIYCWQDRLHDDHPSYLPEIEELARQSRESEYPVCTERMDFTSDKRLWDQMVDKTFELKTRSDLSPSDACIFIVSRSLLPGDAFLEEQAYVSNHSDDYPKGTFPCTGLTYL
jgi:hypothetical protein